MSGKVVFALTAGQALLARAIANGAGSADWVRASDRRSLNAMVRNGLAVQDANQASGWSLTPLGEAAAPVAQRLAKRGAP